MPNHFPPERFGPVAAPLMQVHENIALGPGKPNEEAGEVLEGLTGQSLFPGQTVANQEMAELCLAGLWLLHGYLDRSHTISQSAHSPEGSYWHGLMHRREPDFSNAKYWFGRVGYHSVMDQLAQQVPSLVEPFELSDAARFLVQQERWDAAAFVDLCQRALRQGEAEEFCLAVAALEWELLFEHCYQRATAE